jgi:hypothetical protein
MRSKSGLAAALFYWSDFMLKKIKWFFSKVDQVEQNILLDEKY